MTSRVSARSKSIALGCLLAGALVGGCASNTAPTVGPDQPAGSGGPSADSSPTGPSASGGMLPSGGSPLPGTSGDPSVTKAPVDATPVPVPPEEGGPAFTPPPPMEPQDDEVCLAIVSRAAVQTALGTTIGDIEAQATDPSVQLTCSYAVGTGDEALLLTIATEDPQAAFDRDLAIATGHGQEPVALDGIGDLAFYAAAATDAPEQVVFTKGPVIVRLWNRTDLTAGQQGLADLAAAAAATIEAEIRPAP